MLMIYVVLVHTRESRNSVTIRPAGATASSNCSLCEAGTYQTGSGQDAVIRGHLSIISLVLFALLLDAERFFYIASQSKLQC